MDGMTGLVRFCGGGFLIVVVFLGITLWIKMREVA